MSANCSTCQFWASDNIERKDARWSRCRVNPPETSSRCIDGRFDVWVAQWPWTRSEDWCGAYKSHGMAVGVVTGTPKIEN